MSGSDAKLAPAITGLFVAGLIVSVGTAWAFTRGAPDFSVFYEAWKLVLSGRGAEIYRVSPDRFLYAPGFAWLLSPLAVLPRGAALALWCLLKAAVVGFVIRELGVRLIRGPKLVAAGLAAWGVALIARPLLIDFQYGQVNTLILGAGVWALLCHFQREASPGAVAVSWALLTFAALAKVFPLPLLVVPWLAGAGVPASKLRIERASVIAACALVLLLPLVTESPGGVGDLYLQWKEALLSKGLPLETHNQSLSSFLHRFLTAKPVHVIAQGADGYFVFGVDFLTEPTLALLATAWALIASGLLLAWIMSLPARAPLTWLAVVMGGLILPSHLVWKPYFVLLLPAAILVLARTLSRALSREWLFLLLIFAGVNLTNFDVMGAELASRFEAGAILFWMALLLLSKTVFQGDRRG